jgi:hypothetical protein
LNRQQQPTKKEFIMTGKSFYKFALLFAVTLFSITSCSKNPVEPGTGDDVDETVKVAGQTSVDIYQNLSAFKQVNDLMRGVDALAQMEVPGFENPTEAMNFGRNVQKQALAKSAKLMKTDRLFGVQADSVIWDVTYRDEFLNVTFHSKLIYDDETGVARLTVVGFDYPQSHPLEYDSTEIVADLNSTFLNDQDDVLISVNNLKRFKSGRLVAEEKGSFVPDPYLPGNEPTGGVLQSEITYNSSSFIQKTTARLEYHAGTGGSFSKETEFADDKTSSESVTFNEDGTGSFSETRRDGTSVAGTFDSADEDGQGGYTLTTTFRAGHDPASISESGTFAINAADSTLNGTFEREVRFRDGRVESEEVSIQQTRVGDLLSTSLNVDKSDGSHGFINIVETPDVDQVSGEWTNVDETFVVFTAESYPDDSAHLDFKVYESEAAFENSVPPILSGLFDFYPDGSGSGVITEGDKSYNVTINPDGSVVIEPVV